jgi:hypothetical protein
VGLSRGWLRFGRQPFPSSLARFGHTCTLINIWFVQRAQMKIQPVDATLVDRFVRAHVAMYVGGQSGIYSIPDAVSRNDVPLL